MRGGIFKSGEYVIPKMSYYIKDRLKYTYHFSYIYKTLYCIIKKCIWSRQCTRKGFMVPNHPLYDHCRYDSAIFIQFIKKSKPITLDTTSQTLFLNKNFIINNQLPTQLKKIVEIWIQYIHFTDKMHRVKSCLLHFADKWFIKINKTWLHIFCKWWSFLQLPLLFWKKVQFCCSCWKNKKK